VPGKARCRRNISAYSEAAQRRQGRRAPARRCGYFGFTTLATSSAQPPGRDPRDGEHQQAERREREERRWHRRRRIDHRACRDLLARRRLRVGPAAAERVALVSAGDRDAGEADRRGRGAWTASVEATRSIPGSGRPRRRAEQWPRIRSRRRRSVQTSALSLTPWPPASVSARSSAPCSGASSPRRSRNASWRRRKRRTRWRGTARHHGHHRSVRPLDPERTAGAGRRRQAAQHLLRPDGRDHRAHHGCVVEFLGDGMLCVFGAPTPCPITPSRYHDPVRPTEPRTTRISGSPDPRSSGSLESVVRPAAADRG